MKVIIDGASSCLAQELAHWFLREKHKVAFVSRNKSEFIYLQNKAIKCHDYNEKISQENEEQTLFVQLACATPNNSSLGKIYSDNINITKTINDHILSNNYNYLVNISTMSVYGTIQGDSLSNLSPTVPTDDYGNSKLLIEKTIQSYAETTPRGTKCLTLRLPGLISSKTQNIFLAKCVKKIIKNELIKISPNGKFNNATCSQDIYKTIVNWVKYSSINNSTNSIINMHSSNIINISDLLNHMAASLTQSEPQIAFDDQIKSFIITNDKDKNIPILSPVLDIVQPLLQGNSL